MSTFIGHYGEESDPRPKNAKFKVGDKVVVRDHAWGTVTNVQLEDKYGYIYGIKFTSRSEIDDYREKELSSEPSFAVGDLVLYKKDKQWHKITKISTFKDEIIYGLEGIQGWHVSFYISQLRCSVCQEKISIENNKIVKHESKNEICYMSFTPWTSHAKV